MKSFLVKKMERETSLEHIMSAAIAGSSSNYPRNGSFISIQGIVMSTLTNPVWFIKTRIQIDQG